MRIHLWRNDREVTSPPTGPAELVAELDAPPRDEEAIRAWLSAKLAKLVGLEPAQVHPDATFAEYGLDSMQAVRLSGDLEKWLGRELPPILLYDYPTIGSLARHLAEELAPVSLAGLESTRA